MSLISFIVGKGSTGFLGHGERSVANRQGIQWRLENRQVFEVYWGGVLGLMDTALKKGFSMQKSKKRRPVIAQGKGRESL